MRAMAQMAMVMNLDKCIGCHTCSVTCKQAWTNRTGVEYVWFNNVETRPGQGYPRTYEDQERWRGGWTLDRKGRLRLQGRRPAEEAVHHLLQPGAADHPGLLRALDLRLRDAHRGAAAGAHPGGPAQVAAHRREHEGLLERQLGRRPRRRPRARPGDPVLKKLSEDIKLTYEQSFMFYLPRICEHCLNPSCVASCPSGAIYKREEDGIVLVDQDRCRGWRMCVTGCPYKKVYFNHRTGKAEKCTFCYPRIEVGLPTVCSETCVGRLRYIGLVLYDADRVLDAASTPDPHGPLRGAAVGVARPARPRGGPRVGGRRHPARLDRGRAALPDLEAAARLPGRAAAAPGVPHHADGLVHPAAVAGRRRAARHRPRRRERRQPVRRDRRAAHPDQLPRRAVHRRRHRRRSTGCCASWPRCGPTCAGSTSTRAPTSRSPPRSA